MTPVGHIRKQKHWWYDLEDGTRVSFHTASPSGVVFYSDFETWPARTAHRLGINYVFLRNSTLEEIAEFVYNSKIQLK